MKKGNYRLQWIIFAAVIIFAIAVSSCRNGSEPVPENGAVEALPAETGEELEEPDNDQVAAPAVSPLDYYWPWINHGELVLSNGAIIAAPDIFESEPGFIAEFPPGHSYSGLLVWQLEAQELIGLEWVELNFTADYFENNEWSFLVDFSFLIESLPPLSDESAVFEVDIDLAQQQNGFEVSIKQLLIGVAQDSEFSAEPFNYLGLLVEMTAHR